MDGVFEVGVIDFLRLFRDDFRPRFQLEIHPEPVIVHRGLRDFRLDAVNLAETFQIAAKSRPDVDRFGFLKMPNRGKKA